jgi:hypothetical protein
LVNENPVCLPACLSTLSGCLVEAKKLSFRTILNHKRPAKDLHSSKKMGAAGSQAGAPASICSSEHAAAMPEIA